MIKLSAGQTADPTTLTDSRDGQVYKIVKIGSQTWMAQNLNYGGSAGTVGVCYGSDAANCAKYGRLYDWATAMGIAPSFNATKWGGNDVKHKGICPTGWHLPSEADWSALEAEVAKQSGAGKEGYAMKADAGWIKDDGTPGNGSDLVGFKGLSSGYRNGAGSFLNNAGGSAHFWSSAELDASSAWDRCLGADEDALCYNFSGGYKKFGFSVRCLKD